MNLMTEAIRALGAVLLPVVTGLLLEELTFGGLVRLLIVPWPGTEKAGDPGGRSSSPECKRKKHNKEKGEGK